jgi:hypothetical protein
MCERFHTGYHVLAKLALHNGRSLGAPNTQHPARSVSTPNSQHEAWAPPTRSLSALPSTIATQKSLHNYSLHII